MSARLPGASSKPELDHLEGLVERVTFHSANSGFCVLRLKVKGERELVTLVGHTSTVTPGEYASASGSWVTDREHGKRFKPLFMKISPPNTLTCIQRHLGSGMVKGIGPVYAGRLVKAFGAEVFDTIEQTAERLRKVEGIGEIRAQKNHFRLGGPEGNSRNHGIPARGWSIDLPGRAHLQDLRPERNRDCHGKSLPPSAGYSRHRILVC